MIRQPYLIQRASIRSPLAAEADNLSKAVEFDYMGSAEFEFGALPESLRRIRAYGPAWRCDKVDEIRSADDSPLRAYSAISDEEFPQYVAYLRQLRWPEKYGRLNLKEPTAFEHDHKPWSKYRAIDFWWDLDNDVMFGFHKAFMNRLPSYLKASFAYMDEQKNVNR